MCLWPALLQYLCNAVYTKALPVYGLPYFCYNMVKSNQIYLLKTHHISMQQVVKQLISRANKAQKSTYSDPKRTN